MNRSILVTLAALLVSFQLFAKYQNETGLTVVKNGGNTQQETWNAKTLNSYTLNKNIFKLGGHYAYGVAESELNARNWDIVSRFERELTKDWSTYAAVQHEQDVFAGVEYRWNYDLGGVYHILKSDDENLKGELGYRRTLESDFAGRKVSGTKIRVFTEYSKQHSDNVFFKVWVEALPNVSDSDDWQVSFEPSLNVSLTKMVSLKFGYLHRYDNLPTIGNKKSDYQYTTSIIAKF